jgi:hypothetical protein
MSTKPESAAAAHPDWFQQGMDYAYTEAMDPAARDDWTTEDVAKAFEAGAKLALRDQARAAAAQPVAQSVGAAHEMGAKGPLAINTRRMWAAWRDRAALDATPPAAPEPLTARVAQLEAALRQARGDIKTLHMVQSINNQNQPAAWHDAVDAALEAFDDAARAAMAGIGERQEQKP